MKNKFFIFIIVNLLSLLIVRGQNSNFNTYFDINTVTSSSYINGNIYQKDFLLFVDLLEKCHPAFALHNPPFNIDSLKKSGYEQVAKFKDKTDLEVYLQEIASRLGDGHTSLLQNIDKNKIYPFFFFLDNNSVYLSGINKGFEEFLGKQIVKINGFPVMDVINSFRPMLSCENDVYFYNKVNNFMQSFSYWEHNKYKTPDNALLFTFSDDKELTLEYFPLQNINIVWHKTENTAKNSVREQTRMPFLYKIMPENNICYLQFNSCQDRNSLRYQYRNGEIKNISEWDFEKKISQFPQFDLFLTEMFDSIKKKNIKTLVIDVRDNGGGNSSLCNQLLSWLKPIDSIKSHITTIRFSSFWEQTFPALAEYYKSNLKTDYKLGKLQDAALPSVNSVNKESLPKQKENPLFVMNRDTNKIFKGNIVFIQNSNTYSSAGMLITMAIDNNIGITIGEKSSYRPCNYGDILYWELLNTKIRGIVSHKIFNRPNTEKCAETFITPNVYIPQTWENFIQGNDACWNWILKNF